VLVKKIGAVWRAHRRSNEFASYLEFLRIEFKRKRNFITLLGKLKA